MINKLSAKFTEKLLLRQSITEEERELYIYGFFILLSNLMYIILASLSGLLLGCFLESIVFYIAFQFIRRYAGGYHASTETRCEIISTLSIISSIFVIRLSKQYDFQKILLVVTLVSAIIIFCICPLDTPEKPLSEKEFKFFRKKSRLILIIIISVVIISYFLKLSFLIAPCCVSLIFESLLLVCGKMKSRLR